MTAYPRASISGRLLCVRVTGQLTWDKYEAILSLADRQVQQHGKISVDGAATTALATGVPG